MADDETSGRELTTTTGRFLERTGRVLRFAASQVPFVSGYVNDANIQALWKGINELASQLGSVARRTARNATHFAELSIATRREREFLRTAGVNEDHVRLLVALDNRGVPTSDAGNRRLTDLVLDMDHHRALDLYDELLAQQYVTRRSAGDRRVDYMLPRGLRLLKRLGRISAPLPAPQYNHRFRVSRNWWAERSEDGGNSWFTSRGLHVASRTRGGDLAVISFQEPVSVDMRAELLSEAPDGMWIWWSELGVE